jgi:dCMP deaminase
MIPIWLSLEKEREKKDPFISALVGRVFHGYHSSRCQAILATGYNGAPSRLEHCLDIGCLRQKQGIPSGERHELCRGLHAEQNAIIQAAYHGVEIRGATLYCTNHPCIICSKMLMNAGIQRIVYAEGYADVLAKEMIKESGIDVEKFSRKVGVKRSN